MDNNFLLLTILIANAFILSIAIIFFKKRMASGVENAEYRMDDSVLNGAWPFGDFKIPEEPDVKIEDQEESFLTGADHRNLNVGPNDQHEVVDVKPCFSDFAKKNAMDVLIPFLKMPDISFEDSFIIRKALLDMHIYDAIPYIYKSIQHFDAVIMNPFQKLLSDGIDSFSKSEKDNVFQMMTTENINEEVAVCKSLEASVCKSLNVIESAPISGYTSTQAFESLIPDHQDNMETLFEKLKNGTPAVQGYAAVKLAPEAIKNQSVKNELINKFKVSCDEVKARLVDAFSITGSADFYPFIMGALEDSSSSVRYSALCALKKDKSIVLKNGNKIAKIMKKLCKDTDYHIARVARNIRI